LENHESTEITQLLQRWRTGDALSEAKLVEAIYPVLRKLAHAQIRRSSHFTLQATELANEAYMRLVGQKDATWESRGQFFAIAATIIRRIVLDHFRHRATDKAGGGYQFTSIAELPVADIPAIDESIDWLAIDQALLGLEQEDPELARLVEMKFFSGLSNPQIAEVTRCSLSTVERRWRFARAWLGEHLSDLKP
jgi:RNA polymerase sigma factor (TIGR02999 family)